MSAIKDLLNSIINELERGDLSFEEIARAFDVPVTWIYNAYDYWAEELDSMDYNGEVEEFCEWEPDEAQEWADFDPDC